MSKAGVGERSRALALEECTAIAGGLCASERPHEAVHAARKAIRRLRSLLALLDDTGLELDRTDGTLQRLGGSLSDIRDAYVVVETAEKLRDEHPALNWKPVISVLHARSDRVMRKAKAGDPGFERRRRQIDQIAASLRAQPWEHIKRGELHVGLAHSEQREKKAAKRAARKDDPESVHRWRRRIRRLRMQREAMHAMGVTSGKAHSHQAKTRHLHKVSDRLGWQQDLRMLRNLIRPMGVWEGKQAVLLLVDVELAVAVSHLSRETSADAKEPLRVGRMDDLSAAQPIDTQKDIEISHTSLDRE